MTDTQSINFCIYNTDTGKIRMTCIGSSEMAAIQCSENEAVFTGYAQDDVHYIDITDPANPVIADKTLVPHTVTGNVITLPGDALRCEVTGPIADSFDIPAAETELTFTADVPGQYTLTLSGVKYLETEITVAI